jgi:hypothetical protein
MTDEDTGILDIGTSGTERVILAVGRQREAGAQIQVAVTSIKLHQVAVTSML